MAERIDIGGRLHSTETGNVVAGANEIYDDTKGKKQSVVNQETDAALDDRYTKEETYNKEEVEQMVTPPNPDYKYYSTYADMVAETSHPAGAIYRVSSYDGTQVDATSYAEYTWNGSEYKLLAVKPQVNEVFDITVYNGNTKYADLTAALGVDGANVPEGVRRGGMSVKYVQSSYSRYMQYRYMSDDVETVATFTNTDNWAAIPISVETENPEFIAVFVNKNKKVMYGVQKDANFYFGGGVPKQIKDFVLAYINEINSDVEGKVDKVSGKSLIDKDFSDGVSCIENPEFFLAALDTNKKVLFGSRKDGDFYFGNGVPSQILRALYEKVDKDPAKSLVDKDFAYALYTIENPEWSFLILNSDKKIVAGIKKDNTVTWSVGVPQAIIDYLHDYSKFPIDFGTDAPNSWLVVGDGNEGGRKPYCIALGKRIMTNNTGVKNMVVGYDSLSDCTGSDNTAMGYHASFRNTSGQRNASFGSESQDDNTAGNYNTSMGYCSLQRNNTGDGNVAIGAFALQGTGSYDPENVRDLDGNVAIGLNALYRASSGSYHNIAIGTYALTGEQQYRNCIGVGYNVTCTKNGQTVIGNNDTVETVVRGDLIVKGTDGVSRQIVFNQDGTCSWTEIN